MLLNKFYLHFDQAKRSLDKFTVKSSQRGGTLHYGIKAKDVYSFIRIDSTGFIVSSWNSEERFLRVV